MALPIAERKCVRIESLVLRHRKYSCRVKSALSSTTAVFFMVSPHVRVPVVDEFSRNYTSSELKHGVVSGVDLEEV